MGKMEIAKTKPVKIGGRSFQLAFPLAALLEMKQKIEGFDYSKINEMIYDIGKIADMLCIMAKYGAILNGETLDVDSEWFACKIPPSAKALGTIEMALMQTLTEWMSMEAEDEDRGREIDVVLAEIEKKRTQEN